jgi:aspartate/tyrosine/aromatic aminotransferase
LTAGYTADALVDFTGGVAEKNIIKDMGLSDKHKSYKFFSDIKIAVENKALVNVFIDVSFQFVILFHWCKHF